MDDPGRPRGGRAAGTISGDPLDTDDVAAAEARRCYRRRGLVPLVPDGRITPFLRPCEQLVAVRHGARVDRRHAPLAPPDLSGDLYVTSSRLVHLGRRTVSVDLDEIEEAVVSGEETLLLVLRGGRGVRLDVERPRLLRVQIAAARTARAAPTEPAPSQPPGGAMDDQDPSR